MMSTDSVAHSTFSLERAYTVSADHWRERGTSEWLDALATELRP